MRSIRLRLCLGLLVFASPAVAGPTLTVNSVLDVPGGGSLTDGVCETAAGNGVCSLRAAIMEANHVPSGGAVVVVPAGTYFLSRAIATPDTESAGDLDLLAPMTIEGSASVIDGSAIDRTLDVADVAVVLRGLRVRNGGTQPFYAENGGCVRNAGDLTLDDFATTATCNGLIGGAIFNTGSLVIRRSVISGGVSGGAEAGGGIHNAADATLTVEESLIRDNLAASGGGLGNLGAASIASTSIVSNESTVFNPSAGGGGIYNTGQLELINVTVSGNRAVQHGGGLFVADGSAQVAHSTIAENRANSGDSAGPGAWGGGIARIGSSLVFLRNSIVGENLTGSAIASVPSECFGTITSGDYNVIGSRSTCSLTGSTTHDNPADILDTVGELVANGGFATDHAPVVQGTIPLASCTDLLGAPLRVDGKGHARREFGVCTAGASEGFRLSRESVIGVELLRNGGAAGNEFGLAAPDLGYVPPPYWRAAGGALGQVAYGAPAFPTAADAPAASGSHFFSGGSVTNIDANLSQVFDLSAAAAEIDAGQVHYRLAGAFGGYLDDPDFATLSVVFQDEDRVTIPISDGVIGGYTASDRSNATALLPAEETGLVPPLARTAFVVLTATHLAGTYNDAFADDLSLVLPEPAATLAALAAVATLALGARSARLRAGRGSA